MSDSPKTPTERQATILVLEPFSALNLERLREAVGPQAHLIVEDKAAKKNQLLAKLKSADAVIGAPDPILLAQAPSVRWVQLSWAGSDRYVRHEGTVSKDVLITNVAGGAFGRAMSQYVLGQILAITQRLPTYVRQQSDESWEWAGPIVSLDGARVLVFGAGDIGRWTARRLQAFEAFCVGVCRDTSTSREPFRKLVTLDGCEEELAQADVVVNCLPGTSETDGFLDARRLRLMKRESVLVNVGRGSFIDSDALADVLAEGRLRGAALDVCNPEPLPAGHRLWHEPRCLITPHVSGRSFGPDPQIEEAICDIVCENLRRWMAGDELTHLAR